MQIERSATSISWIPSNPLPAPLKIPWEQGVMHHDPLKPSAEWPFLVTRPFTIWTTVELTIRADGTSTQHLAGASPFPRHWLYDDGGHLVEKAALTRAMLWETRRTGPPNLLIVQSGPISDVPGSWEVFAVTS
jgi:hypothetical protein